MLTRSCLPCLSVNTPEENIERIIYRSLRVKKNVVENDEREQGQRACLNFGHTIGHGIEAVKGVRGRRTNGLFHGECVALGMLPMIEDKSLVRRTRAIYRTLGLPTRTGVDKNKGAELYAARQKERGQHHYRHQGARPGLLARR